MRQQAIPFTQTIVSNIRALAPGKLLSLHESWWPTFAGDPRATDANQVGYFRALAGSGIPFIYGEGYDQFWKTGEGPQGPHWGLFTRTGGAKPVVSQTRADYGAPFVSPSVAVGSGSGQQLRVVFQDDSVASITAFPAGTRGVRVALGDVDGDGFENVVAAAGPGGLPLVKVMTHHTSPMTTVREFSAFENTFLGGVYVSVGDMNGDGAAEVVVSPDEGGGPRVRVLDGLTGNQLADFLGIEDANFRGGARTALGDVNRDGVLDLLVAAGFGGGPRVACFDGKLLLAGQRSRVFNDRFVFEPGLRNGAFIASGDLNGDGFMDVVAGGGPGGGPRVFALSGADLLNGQATQLANFFGGDEASRGGIRVTMKDLDADTRADIVVGAGELAAGVVTEYLAIATPTSGTPPVHRQYTPISGEADGVFVG